MFHKILVAMDYSERSRQALDEAIRLAKVASGQIMILHVLSALDKDYPTQSKSAFPDVGYVDSTLYMEIMRRYAQHLQTFERDHAQILQSLARDAEAQDLPVDWRLLYGDAGCAICQTAQDWQADLIVMGRRGRTGLKEVVLGSVSNYVMHHAPCSVLIVQEHLSGDLVNQEEMFVF
jgi:nucleotide-binding universal stress UspA family protein